MVILPRSVCTDCQKPSETAPSHRSTGSAELSSAIFQLSRFSRKVFWSDFTRQEARMSNTMRAIVLDAPGPPDALTIRELPIPTPAAGWVLIEVRAFGLNRSELHTRQGLAS